jgi:hypothetical protein
MQLVTFSLLFRADEIPIGDEHTVALIAVEEIALLSGGTLSQHQLRLLRSA